MRMRFKGLMCALSLIGAGIGCAAAEMISGFTKLNSIAMSGIYFVLPMALAIVGAILAEYISPSCSENITGVYVKCSVLALSVVIIGGIIASVGAQFLYETQWKKSDRNIVLMIDTSSSMGTETNTAFNAAKQIMDMTYSGDKAALIYFDANANRIMRLTRMDGDSKEKLMSYLEKGAVAGGGTDFDNALNAASDEIPVEGDTAVFMITDGESLFNDKTEAKFLSKNAALYVINIARTDNDSLKLLAEKTGGSYSHSVNSEIGSELHRFLNLYLSRDDGMLLKDLRRTTLSMPYWYYAVINCLLYLLLGIIASLAYTVLVNRKDILFVYNIVGGAVAAVLNEVNNLFVRADFISAILMFLLICPAVCIISNLNEDKSPVTRMSGSTNEKLIK